MIAFIGSGPHNLTTLKFLLKANPDLRSEVTVYDPSGRWLTRWRAQMAQQEIVHLRSSSVHHPDPDPLALRRFAAGRPEFYPPYDLPGTSLFQEFLDDLVQSDRLDDLVEPRRVERIVPEEGQLRIRLDDGREVVAQHVVAALGGGEPVWPSDAPDPEPPTMVHSHDVDLSSLPPGPGTILIVGGGLTAGHLALGALRRGWSVDLVSRRRIKYKLFDSAPGWIGPKHMEKFQRETSWSRRRQMVARARGGGAMTEEIRDLLAPFAASGALRRHSGCQVTSLARQSGWLARVGWGKRLHANRVWMCTGYRLDLRSAPLFTDLWTRYPLQLLDGLPVLDSDCRWPGLPLYLMGLPSALRVGPTARNFPGARHVASRIVRSITGVTVPPH